MVALRKAKAKDDSLPEEGAFRGTNRGIAITIRTLNRPPILRAG